MGKPIPVVKKQAPAKSPISKFWLSKSTSIRLLVTLSTLYRKKGGHFCA